MKLAIVPPLVRLSAGLLAITDQIGEPTDGARLHGDGGGTDRVGADVLVEGGAEKIRNDANRDWRRCDQAHVAGVPDMGAIGKQLPLDFLQDGFGGAGILRQRLVKEFCQGLRLDVGKHGLFFDVLEVSASRSTIWFPILRNSFESIDVPGFLSL